MNFVKSLLLLCLLSPTLFAARGDFYVEGDDSFNTEAALKHLAVLNWFQKNRYGNFGPYLNQAMAEKFVLSYSKSTSKSGKLVLKGTLDVEGLEEYAKTKKGEVGDSRKTCYLEVRGVDSLAYLGKISQALSEIDLVQKTQLKEISKKDAIYQITSTVSASELLPSLRNAALLGARWELIEENKILLSFSK